MNGGFVGDAMPHRKSKFAIFYRLVVGATVSLWVLTFVALTYWYYHL